MKAIGILFIGLSLLSMLIGGTLIYVIAIIFIAKVIHSVVTKLSIKGNKKANSLNSPVSTHRNITKKDTKYARPRNNSKPVVQS